MIHELVSRTAEKVANYLAGPDSGEKMSLATRTWATVLLS